MNFYNYLFHSTNLDSEPQFSALCRDVISGVLTEILEFSANIVIQNELMVMR